MTTRGRGRALDGVAHAIEPTLQLGPQAASSLGHAGYLGQPHEVVEDFAKCLRVERDHVGV